MYNIEVHSFLIVFLLDHENLRKLIQKTAFLMGEIFWGEAELFWFWVFWGLFFCVLWVFCVLFCGFVVVLVVVFLWFGLVFVIAEWSKIMKLLMRCYGFSFTGQFSFFYRTDLCYFFFIWLFFFFGREHIKGI